MVTVAEAKFRYRAQNYDSYSKFGFGGAVANACLRVIQAESIPAAFRCEISSVWKDDIAVTKIFDKITIMNIFRSDPLDFQVESLKFRYISRKLSSMPRTRSPPSLRAIMQTRMISLPTRDAFYELPNDM